MHERQRHTYDTTHSYPIQTWLIYIVALRCIHATIRILKSHVTLRKCHVTLRMSHVTLRMSHVTLMTALCCIFASIWIKPSHATPRMSHVTLNMSHVALIKAIRCMFASIQFRKNHATLRMSHVALQMSHVTLWMSYVTHQALFGIGKALFRGACFITTSNEGDRTRTMFCGVKLRCALQGACCSVLQQAYGKGGLQCDIQLQSVCCSVCCSVRVAVCVLQCALRLAQKGLISHQKRPVSHQKSPRSHQKSSISHQKSHFFHIHKRAHIFTPLFGAKEPHITTKEPHFTTKEPSYIHTPYFHTSFLFIWAPIHSYEWHASYEGSFISDSFIRMSLIWIGTHMNRNEVWSHIRVTNLLWMSHS